MVHATDRLPIVRPVTRADCANVPRPCPFVSCRFNLLVDVRANGSIAFNATGSRQPQTVGCSEGEEAFNATADAAVDAWFADEDLPSCALDVIDDRKGDESSLAEIADALRVSRQGVDLHLNRALPKLERRLSKLAGEK